MMESKHRFTTRMGTFYILLGITVLLIIWDLYVANTATPGDTISELVLGYAREHPVVPFIFGVIMGHFFWPQVELITPTKESTNDATPTP